MATALQEATQRLAERIERAGLAELQEPGWDLKRREPLLFAGMDIDQREIWEFLEEYGWFAEKAVDTVIEEDEVDVASFSPQFIAGFSAKSVAVQAFIVGWELAQAQLAAR